MMTMATIPNPLVPLYGAIVWEPLPVWELAAILAGSVVVFGIAAYRRSRSAAGHLAGQIAAGVQWAAAGTFSFGLLSLGLIALRQWVPEVSASIEPVWPWPIVLVIAIAMLGLVLATYPSRIQHLPLGSRRILLGLRLAALVVLLFAMLRPAVQWTRTDRQSSVFAVLSDPTRSMNTADEVGGTSRYAAEQKTLAEIEPLLKAFGREAQVEKYEFGKELLPVKEWSAEAAGEQTALGYTLDELAKSSQSRRVVGALVLSDFKQAALEPRDVDPRTVAQRLAELRIPLYTVPYGSSNASGASLDLIAEDLQVSPTVFEKNEVIVSAKIRALGAAGRELTVRLLVETRGVLPGEASQMEVHGLPQRIRPADGEDLLPVELSFTPQTAGEFKIAVEAVPVDGELLKVNNTLTTFITVLKGGLNVAYFDKVRPEQKFIRRVTESPDIQLDFHPIRYQGRSVVSRVDSDWFLPGKYDVYIIGDVPARVFDQAGPGGRPLQLIRQAVERGAGLLMTGGFQSFGPGGYAETPLADILPVTMSPTEIQNDKTIDKTLHFLQPLKMLPAAAGLGHFVMRIDALDKNAARWKSLAPLEGANKFTRLKPLAQVLAETETKTPLLVAQDVGQGRTMAFAADTTYQWFLSGEQDAHQRFWRQMILWLAHKEMQGDSSVWLKLNERRFRPGQPLELTFGARSPEGLPLENAQFTVDIKGPDGQSHRVPPQRLGKDFTGRFADTLKPGEYVARVEAQHNGQPVGLTQSRFLVYEQDLELHNPAADFALAEELAKSTGGEYVHPEQLSSFLQRLLREGLKSEAKQVSNVTLWDNWLVVVLFVTILSVEWFYRKRRGLV